MVSFIKAPSTILLLRPKKPSSKCSIYRRTFPHASRTNPVMQNRNFSPNDEMDDADDDAVGGLPDTSGLGMHAPNLTTSEKIYLDGARDNNEYIVRMQEVARKKEKEREMLQATNPSQTPDDYIESLATRREQQLEGDYGGPRIDATDEYMDNLGRMYRQRQGIKDAPLPSNRRGSTAPAGPVVDPALVAKPDDSIDELQDKIRAIEQEISQVSQSSSRSEDDSIAAEVTAKLKEMASLREGEAFADDEEEALDMTLEEGARKLAELQRQIREEADLEDDSVSDPQSETEPDLIEISDVSESESDSASQVASESTESIGSLRQSHVGEEPGTVDKQIEFLESYLSRLQQEAAEDPGTEDEDGAPEVIEAVDAEDLQTTMSTLADQVGKMPNERVTFQGIEDTAGEMTAAEKVAIFEELRRRAASEQQPSSEFADPFNITLPERKSDSADPFNVSLPERRSETNLDDDGDEPSPESEAEYDSFDNSLGDKNLLIEEIESEVMAYTRDVKALLRKHETRLQVLLSRLRLL